MSIHRRQPYVLGEYARRSGRHQRRVRREAWRVRSRRVLVALALVVVCGTACAVTVVPQLIS